MYTIELSPDAEQQLEDLFATIQSDSGRERARSFVGSLVSYLHGFDLFPARGAMRDDIRPGIRIVGFKRRVSIAFTIEDQRVIFLGIFYGGQNFEAILRGDDPQE